MTIESGSYTVKTSSGVTIGNTVYNASGALEISASKDSSRLINGVVNVTDEQVGVKVENDSNGVNVTISNGAVTSLTNVNGTVKFGGVTYKNDGGKIFKDGKVYNVTDATNIFAVGQRYKLCNG